MTLLSPVYSNIGLWRSLSTRSCLSFGYPIATPILVARTFSTHSHLLQRKENEHSHSHEASEKAHTHSHDTSHSHSHSGASELFGHTHSHSSAESVFTQEKGGLRNPAIRITWVGLLVNLGMAVGKGVGGVLFHSQALLADAVHAVSDLVSDFLTLATVSVAASPPSKLFPNGYGKIETLGSLGVSSLLLLAGVSVGWSGFISLVTQLLGDTQIVTTLTTFLGHGHSHSHGDGHDGHAHGVDLNAMWLALASIGVKEWLFHATTKVAKQTGSTVLIANAWHHRIDSLTSVVAVVTIGGSYFLGLTWLDALGGLAVSSVIIRAGFRNGKAAALELADSTVAVNENLLEAHKAKAESILAEQVALSKGQISVGDFEVHKVSLMPSGPNFVSEIQLSTRPNMPTVQSVTAALFLENRILQTDKRVRRAVVNVIDTETLAKNKSLEL